MRESLIPTLLFVCLLAIPGLAQTDPPLFLNTPFAVNSVDVGDFDQDGLLDAAHVTGLASSDLTIEINQGKAALPIRLVYPGMGGAEVRALDLDGDGDLDFLCTGQAVFGSANATLKVVLNNGSSLSATTIQVKGSALPSHVDIDNDGMKDLLSQGAWNRALAPGIFAATSTPLVVRRTGFPLPANSIFLQREYEAGDFNGDGVVDLLRYRQTGGGSAGFRSFADLYLNDGSGNFDHHFSEFVSHSFLQVPSTRLIVDDFNDDGIDDFVAENQAPGDLVIHYGDATGYFIGGTFQIGGFGYFVTMADLDGDGDRDLVVRRPVSGAPLPPTPAPNSLNVIENFGGGVFLEQTTSSLSFFSAAFVAADLDADGRDDALYAGGPGLPGFGVAYGSMVSATNVSFRQIFALSGQSTTIPVDAPLPAPLQVAVADENGSAVPGQVLTVDFDPGITALTPLMTDASGLAGVVVGAPSTTGLKRITVSCPAAVSLRFLIDVTPTELLTVVSGNGQGANPNTNYPEAVRLKLTDLAGTPIANAPVEFFDHLPSSGGLGGTTLFTNNLGEVFATLNAGPVGSASNPDPGTKYFIARTPNSGEILLTMFVRRLVTLNFFDTTGTYRGVRYHHENALIPLILMADVPQPAPVPTIYGNVHTSWLSPGPNLFVLDGLGLTGPPVPGLFTWPMAGQPGFVYQLTFPNTLLPFGTQAVFQILSYDNAYAFPAKVGLSEPALIIF